MLTITLIVDEKENDESEVYRWRCERNDEVPFISIRRAIAQSVDNCIMTLRKINVLDKETSHGYYY